MSGRLGLSFGRDAVSGQTEIVERAWTPPLQVVREFAQPDGACLVHLQNIAGGVLGGDDLSMAIEVRNGAQAAITTTGATRVYRSAGRDSRLTTTVTVGRGGLLEYLPDALIPFAGARLRQETRIRLDDGAGLLWWETVAPGRLACGEKFAYDLLDLRMAIDAVESRAGTPTLRSEIPEAPGAMPLTLGEHGDSMTRPILIERVRLEPKLRPMESPTRLGPYLFFTTFYACRVREPVERWRTLEDEMSALAESLSIPGEMMWGVSRLPAHGVVVRGLSRIGRDLPLGLHAFRQVAKRALYGRDAVPPRKIY
jgi:urease accessory protein